MTFSEILNMFLDSRRRGDGTAVKAARERTIRNYRCDLKYLFDFLESQGLTDWKAVERDHIRHFIENIRSQEKWREASKNKIFRSTKAFFNWIADDEDCRLLGLKGFLRQIPRIPRNEHRTYLPTKTELLRFFEGFKRHTRSGLRNYTAGMLMLDTGMRIGELRALKLGDVRLSDRLVLVPEEGKTGSRIVFITDETVRDLRRWLLVREQFAKCDYLFVTEEGYPCSELLFVHAWMRNRQKTGIGQGRVGRTLTPHTLRHYFSTDWVRNGGDLAKLKAMTGHKSFETLNVYLHLAADKAVAAEQERVSPRRMLGKHQISNRRDRSEL